MIKINISTIVDPAVMRQTEDGNGRWKDAIFCLNSQEECDFWVVIEDLPNKKETAVCDPACTLLVTTEPPEIKTYDKKFTEQFAQVLTCQDIKSPNAIMSQQALPWMVGVEYGNKRTIAVKATYQDFKKARPSEIKNNQICVIASKKRYTKDHIQRDVFINRLKKEFGGQVHIFGNGYENIKDKAMALYPCKYQVVMENSHLPHYWTEKLSDAFLSFNYPFYYGCTNIGEYFDPQSYAAIDIYNPDKAINTIKSALNEGAYERSIKHITGARERVLDNYNFFEVVYSIAQKSLQKNPIPNKTILRSQDSFKPLKKLRNFFKKILK